jgi:glucose/arabinose dehydrogenase
VINLLLRVNLILFIVGMLIIMHSSSYALASWPLLISGLIILLGIAFTTWMVWGYYHFLNATSSVEFNETDLEYRPHINDKNLKAELVVEGLKHPTSMAFLGPDDFLVLEKKSGIVKRIVNGNILEPPLLDVHVANEKERGMLGIAISTTDGRIGEDQKVDKKGSHGMTGRTYVFLYFTESSGKDGNDDCPLVNYCKAGTEPKGNRLYRYELYQDKLVNPKLMLDLPATPGSDHLGGAIIIGPDRNIYLTTGDGDSCSYHSCDNGTENTVLNSQSANVKNGQKPNGRGGILRVTQDGLAVREEGKDGILGQDSFLNKYYAYGIRNSFGIDFDPLSGKLWDTENGPSFGDEINLVEPGFNSGWMKIQGIWPILNYTFLIPQGLFPPYRGYFAGNMNELIRSTDAARAGLVDFKGEGKYSDPEFIWNMTVGVTALKFLDSDKLGKKYENDMFAADYNNGNLYHFDLSRDRSKLALNGSLNDKIAESSERQELNNILFGEGFDSITDIEVGPDGYLYVVSYGEGKIFRIVPVHDK